MSDLLRGYFRFMLSIRTTWLEDSQLILDRLKKEYDLSKLRVIDIVISKAFEKPLIYGYID